MSDIKMFPYLSGSDYDLGVIRDIFIDLWAGKTMNEIGKLIQDKFVDTKCGYVKQIESDWFGSLELPEKYSDPMLKDWKIGEISSGNVNSSINDCKSYWATRVYRWIYRYKNCDRIIKCNVCGKGILLNKYTKNTKCFECGKFYYKTKEDIMVNKKTSDVTDSRANVLRSTSKYFEDNIKMFDEIVNGEKFKAMCCVLGIEFSIDQEFISALKGIPMMCNEFADELEKKEKLTVYENMVSDIKRYIKALERVDE